MSRPYVFSGGEVTQITAIRIGRGRRRVSVFLAGSSPLSLAAEVVAREGLQVGQELSSGQVELLVSSDRFRRCLNAAVHYLGYRPRSKFETRQRLERRGFDVKSIEAVIGRLEEQGLVDDRAFAQFWKDNREAFGPRGGWLIRSELRRKGVSEDVIDQVVGEVDDTDSAYRTASSKARRLSLSDYEGFRRRLGEHLRRRGFGYEVINHVVERLWQDRAEQP